MSTQRGLAKNEQGSSVVHQEPRPSVAPACDVYESRDEILVVADVPGVAADQLEIHFDKNELTITAHRQSPLYHEGSFVTREYKSCDFRRRFAVPGGIDATKICADLRDGVLQLHMPKSDALRPREIPVRAG